MSETASNARGALYIISCAASSATLVPNLVRQAQTASWEVCVITTPQGTKFIDSPLLERLMGYVIYQDKNTVSQKMCHVAKRIQRMGFLS